MDIGAISEHVTRAEGFLELGDALSAWETLDDLPALEQTAPPVLLLRVTILVCLEYWEKAEILAQSCTEIAPSDARLWYSLAVARAKQGKEVDARAALQHACALDQDLRLLAVRDEAFVGFW